MKILEILALIVFICITLFDHKIREDFKIKNQDFLNKIEEYNKLLLSSIIIISLNSLYYLFNCNINEGNCKEYCQTKRSLQICTCFNSRITLFSLFISLIFMIVPYIEIMHMLENKQELNITDIKKLIDKPNFQTLKISIIILGIISTHYVLFNVIPYLFYFNKIIMKLFFSLF